MSATDANGLQITYLGTVRMFDDRDRRALITAVQRVITGFLVTVIHEPVTLGCRIRIDMGRKGIGREGILDIQRLVDRIQFDDLMVFRQSDEDRFSDLPNNRPT